MLTLIESKPKNESTREASTKEFEKFLIVNELSIHDFLAKVWIQGEHKGIYRALGIFCATYPTDVKLWTMKIQIELYKNHKNGLKQAIKKIERAISANSIESSHSEVFLYLAELEKLRGNFSKAREALLKRKRLFQSSSSHKYKYGDENDLIASVKLEIHFKDNAKARKLLAKALNRFPSSEKIRLLAISMEDRSKRGEKLAEAIKACGDSSLLALAAAKNFASRGNVKKSRKWFENAIMQSDYGEPVLIEAWAGYYKFEKMWGTEKSTNEMLLRF